MWLVGVNAERTQRFDSDILAHAVCWRATRDDRATSAIEVQRTYAHASQGMERVHPTAPCIGILALQGAFEEHGKIIRELGARTVEVSGDAGKAGTRPTLL